VGPEWSRLNRQEHRYCRRVPARGNKPFERRTLRGGFVEVVGLGVKLGGKTLDVFARNEFLRTFEAHPDMEIIKPLDHAYTPFAAIAERASTQRITTAATPKPMLLSAYLRAGHRYPTIGHSAAPFRAWRCAVTAIRPSGRERQSADSRTFNAATHFGYGMRIVASGAS
jgi:hypothetical protein